MPISTCDNCQGDYAWNWEDAFDKFGFNDGDGQVETYSVVSVLEEAGYTVGYGQFSMHNTTIHSIKKDGKELIPETAECGYDDPREYLPKDIAGLLDGKLPAGY